MDITKCTSEDCPLKEHCYRYTSELSDYGQSYFAEPPYKLSLEDKTVTCDMFWGDNASRVFEDLKKIMNK